MMEDVCGSGRISAPIHKPRHWIEVIGLLHALAALPLGIEPVAGIALPLSLIPQDVITQL
jgi:hypothetical protein